MKVRIIKGTNQIGGSITSIESNKGTNIIIDYGKDLGDKETIIPIINWKECSGVFITHIHDDHIGLINEIPGNIPIYVEHISYEIYRKTLEFTNQTLNCNVYTFKIGDEIDINDIKIKSYITDHSAFNSLMYLIECDGKKLLHTGDFRTNGYKGKLVKRMIDEIKKVDAIVMEGTTLSRNSITNIKEEVLADEIYEDTKNFDQVFILQSSTNIDRITTMYKAMKRSNHLFIEDVYTANITKLLKQYNYKIPNPITFSDINIFIPFNRSEFANKNKSQMYQENIEPFLRLDAHIKMCKSRFALMVKESMIRDIRMYYKKGLIYNACLVYSMWDGYKEDERMKTFLEEIKQMNIRILTHHVSGHADENDRNLLLNNLDYKFLIPIHTTEKQKFTKYPNAYILDDMEDLNIV